MDRDALVVQTKRHTGNRSSSGTLTVDDTWYADRVNEAYRWVATFQGHVTRPGSERSQFRSLRFYELQDELSNTIASASSTNFVEYQTGVFTLIALYDMTNDRYVPRRSERHLMKRNRTETGAAPLIWAPAGDGNVAGYKVWPIPTSDTSVIEYARMYPTDLGASDSPVIPEAWHPLIHIKAGSLACDLLKMYDDADRLERKALEFIASRKTPVEEAMAAGGARWVPVGAIRRV